MNHRLLQLTIAIILLGSITAPGHAETARTLSNGPGNNNAGLAANDDPDKRPFSVTQPDDLMLNCDQLWAEAFTMRQIIASTQDMRSDSEMKIRGIGVLGTAASYLVGTVTGGIGIAAAGMIAKEAASSNEESAEKIQDVAEQRRTLMVSLFNIRQCEGDIQQAMIDPKPQSPLEAITSADKTDEAQAQVEPASGPASIRPERQYNN